MTDFFRNQFRPEFEAVSQPLSGHIPSQDYEEATDEDAELEFCLFAGPSATASAPVQKIRMRSPPPTEQNPGFMVPNRNMRYYFTGNLSPAHRTQFVQAAVTGEDIIKRAAVAWPGCALPWKMIKISDPKFVQKVEDSKGAIIGQGTKRKRAGKKARIARRKRAVAAKEKKELAERTAAEKEALERDKKTKKNREKKAKKRLRDKAKKAAEEGAQPDSVTEEAATSFQNAGAEGSIDVT